VVTILCAYTFSNICIALQVDNAGRINMKKFTEFLTKNCGIKDQSILDKIPTTCGNSGEGKISFRF
jgi:hypothetical protein